MRSGTVYRANRSKSALRGTTILVTLGVAAFVAMPAVAQASEEAASLETVVVTGSRLISSAATSPTPLTTVPTDELLQLTPTSIPDALNKLPEFIGSQTPRRPGGGGTNLASNVLNLRGFGPQRTLVLLDGHRVPPANADGSVDVDTLPEMLMSRVDIVTGGASAVYGSDAIAGVVNYILDKKFTGVKFDANAGISDYGDGAGYKVGIAAGTDLFGGKGHIEGSVSRENRDAVANADRPYGPAHWTATGSGTAAAPYGVTPANRQDSSFGGKITFCANGCTAALNQQFVSNGVLGPFDPGTNSTTSNIGSGGSGAYAAYSTALSSMRTTQSFGRFSYDVLDNVQFFVQSSYNQAYSTGWHFPNKFNPGGSQKTTNGTVTINQASIFFKNNPFLTPAVQTALGNDGTNNVNTNTFSIGEYIDDFGAAGTNGTRNLNVNKMVSTGFQGDIFDRFHWDLTYTYGINNSRVLLLNNINVQKLFAAEDAVNVGGSIQCYAATQAATAAAYADCVPVNPFGRTAMTQAQFGYFTKNTSYKMDNTVHDVAGSIAGTLFDNWAGPVKMAISGEARWVDISVANNVGDATAKVDCTGLRICANTLTVWQQNVIPAFTAKDNVQEVAAELELPILADMPFAKEVSVNLAGRYTSYSAAGLAWTHKIGIVWALSDSLRFRGTESVDIRAPSLTDLYNPAQASTSTYTDLLTNVSKTVNTYSKGNPDLKVENARTYTLGVVATPSFIPGLTASLDYYHVSMHNQISTISGTDATVGSLCLASGGTSPYCALYSRPYPFSDTSPANFPTALYSETLNTAQATLEGFDLELGYGAQLADLVSDWRGNLNIRAYANYQPLNSSILYPTAPVTKAVNGVAVAKFNGTLSVNYALDSWTYGVQAKYAGRFNEATIATQVWDPKWQYVHDYVIFDARVEKQFTISGIDMSAYFVVNNLANVNAPIARISTGIGLTYPIPYAYDIMGRYYTIGLRANL